MHHASLLPKSCVYDTARQEERMYIINSEIICAWRRTVLMIALIHCRNKTRTLGFMKLSVMLSVN